MSSSDENSVETMFIGLVSDSNKDVFFSISCLINSASLEILLPFVFHEGTGTTVDFRRVEDFSGIFFTC